jgi:hypothetical protein
VTLAFAMLCAGAAQAAPTPHKLPAASLAYGAIARSDPRMRVELRPLTAATWVDGHDPDVLLRWRERRAYTPLPGPVPIARQLWVALVPRPSLEVTIHNDSDRPLRFADADIRLSDDEGATYTIATSARDYLRDLLGPAMVASAALWLTRLRWGPVELWPSVLSTGLAPWPVGRERALASAIVTAAEQVPLFGRRVVVPAHGSWSGALVFDSDAGSGDALARRLRGNLYVAWHGARFGDEPAEPFLATLPLDPAPTEQDCLTAPFGDPDRGLRHGVGPPLAIDGMAVTRTEAEDEMIALHASRADAQRARRMRVAGAVLIGAGVLGTAGVAATIAIAGHPHDAPAGVSMLALTGVGAVLNYVGKRREQAAMARYNAYMRETGACAAPR